MRYEVLVGVLFTEEEFIHLFTKEINTYILNRLIGITWLDKIELLNEFIYLMKKSDNLHNIAIYLQQYIFSDEYYFIFDLISDLLSDINAIILDNNFTTLKNMDNFIIRKIIKRGPYPRQDIKYFIGYVHNFTHLNSYFKITDLEFDTDLLLKSLNNHNKSLKLKNINMNENIVNIINSYMTISIKNIKIETFISA